METIIIITDNVKDIKHLTKCHEQANKVIDNLGHTQYTVEEVTKEGLQYVLPRMNLKEKGTKDNE